WWADFVKRADKGSMVESSAGALKLVV
ncbi:integrase, partial [Salmonella enterica subsp. enterica serovar Typhimurium var. 5-]|nr:integrase [Salmonella enterica subsp. enterica serovar Typhimurium var. 5-]ECE0714513.1 integrase [Salmonella enterica subsp. enterica]ECF7305828.1 integrase [Salmonella enterica subsp. enterica serovar 4,12:nonmotile]ECI2076534.1 integrase [Salmonella enterica subsp. enterica serovar Kentucky]ECS4803152.1 integrase [Salmonella enterica subsp. enterica serovar Typhimurium]